MSKKAKQKYLYHASAQNNLRTIGPRSETIPRGFEKGPVVFASDDYIAALKFIIPTNDNWTQLGAFNGEHYFICKDESRLNRKDKGGAIYKLSSEGFKQYRGHEWFSKDTVRPIGKKRVESGLEEMIKNSIKVFFVDDETFKKIAKSKDHGMLIMNSLVSENEKRGMKFKKFG